jgi:hypothetical protein
VIIEALHVLLQLGAHALVYVATDSICCDISGRRLPVFGSRTGRYLHFRAGLPRLWTEVRG